MFYYGEHIAQMKTNQLKPVKPYNIYKMLETPDYKLAEQVNRIRQVMQIDPGLYTNRKKRLPYFTVSQFTNNIRKSNNFIKVNFFVIDIDNCYKNESQFIDLRNNLTNDERTFMLFTSPGGKGLKVIFRLNNPIMQPKIYSDFYKAFAYRFAEQYNLSKYIDMKTHDVCRVCFLSHDPEAYYNTLANNIEWEKFLPYPELINTETDQPEYTENNNTEKDESEEKQKISVEKYKEILKKLNPGFHSPKVKNYFVPKILNKIEKNINKSVSDYNIKVEEIRDINYGKKYIFRHEHNMAELNIYYGKKGFTVVKSFKNGTLAELNNLVHRLVEQCIFSLKTT